MLGHVTLVVRNWTSCRHGEAGFFLYFLRITPRSGPTGGQNGLARPFRTIS